MLRVICAYGLVLNDIKRLVLAAKKFHPKIFSGWEHNLCWRCYHSFPLLTQKEKWVWLVRLGTEVHSQLKFKTVFCMYYYIPYCGVPNHMSYMCHHYIKVDYVYLIAVQCLILDDKYINLKCNQRWQNRAYVHKIHPSHYSTYLICFLTYTSSVTCITPLRTVVAYMLQGN